MKNTEYDLASLDSVISSEESLLTLAELISDLGLEIKDIRQA